MAEIPNEAREKMAKHQEALAKIMDTTAQNSSTMREYATVMDNIIRTSGAGSASHRFQDVFFGMNRLSQIPELPIHRSTQGLIFLTRPDLNLAYDNISQVRQMSHLLTNDTRHAMNAIRLALDPSTQRGRPVFSKMFGRQAKDPIFSPLTDLLNPYMAMLSNACVTMSQPPDLGTNFYTSPEGNFKEQFIMSDSITQYNSYYDLTLNFSNFQSNAVLMTLLTWLLYIGFLRSGHMTPHPHNRIRNRMDYFTRIERYKMDVSGRFVEQWFHTGASAPKSVSIGNGFGLNRLEPLEMENKEISVQFGSVGAVYQDPIQLWEFNLRMIRWNPNLRDETRKRFFYKVPHTDWTLTNYFGYPLINLATLEMEWWVSKGDYRNLMQGLYDVDKYEAELEAYTQQHKGRVSPLAK